MADQGAEGLLSPYLRRKRLQAAAPHIKARTLDFGCGSGALAALVDCKFYLGVDIDSFSLDRAHTWYPEHTFSNELPQSSEEFDTVVSLAVIEHMADPVEHLKTLAMYLRDSPSAHIVITTPHPRVDWVHDIGASIGLFSKHANEEHEDLLDERKLADAGLQAGLALVSYSRFLLGANQLALYKKSLR